MKKYMKIILIVLILAAMAIGILSVVRGSKAKDHAPLVCYSWSYGGGMSGGHSSLKIRKLDGEKALITTSEAEWHNLPAVITETYVPATVLTEIEEVFDRYKIYGYDDLPEQKVHALDAGSTYYTFRYEDGNSVSFDSEEQIPSKGYDGLREIDGILSAASAQGERLPVLVVEVPEEEMGYYHEVYTPGEIGVEVYEYSEGTLRYRLSNGTEEIATVEGRAELFLLNGEERVPVYAEKEPGSYIVYPENDDEKYVSLPERMEAGNYVLVFGEYEDEFEIR